MSMRLASYGVCVRNGRVLLVQVVQPCGTRTWTLPGGGVEQSEDPFDCVIREIAEETGCAADVVSLLGVDSRVIPEAEAWSGEEHQNIGVFYGVEVTGGTLRAEHNGDTSGPTWVEVTQVPSLPRSSLVDVGVALHQDRPATGHVPSVEVGGPVWH